MISTSDTILVLDALVDWIGECREDTRALPPKKQAHLLRIAMKETGERLNDLSICLAAGLDAERTGFPAMVKLVDLCGTAKMRKKVQS